VDAELNRPSTAQTADITLRFSGTNHLYAGIIRTPLDPAKPRLNILRTGDFTGAAEMSV